MPKAASVLSLIPIYVSLGIFQWPPPTPMRFKTHFKRNLRLFNRIKAWGPSIVMSGRQCKSTADSAEFKCSELVILLRALAPHRRAKPSMPHKPLRAISSTPGALPVAFFARWGRVHQNGDVRSVCTMTFISRYHRWYLCRKIDSHCLSMSTKAAHLAVPLLARLGRQISLRWLGRIYAFRWSGVTVWLNGRIHAIRNVFYLYSWFEPYIDIARCKLPVQNILCKCPLTSRPRTVTSHRPGPTKLKIRVDSCYI